MSRRVPSFAAAAGMVVAAVFAASPAHADLALVTCVGSSSATYSPGLTNVSRPTQVTGVEEAGCLSLTHPGLRSFTSTFDGELSASCTTLLAPGSGTQEFVWNGSPTQKSAWSWTSSQTAVNGSIVFTVTGPITSGVLAGSTLTQVLTVASLDLLACGTPSGIAGYDGASVWTFSGV